MPRSAMKQLRETCSTLVSLLDGGKHCLFPHKYGDGCIDYNLSHPTAVTQRHIHQRGGRKAAVLYDLDPNDLCAACAAEWHVKIAAVMCLRAQEFQAEMSLPSPTA